ncbi:MAG: HD domain-containing protein [Phycisphaerae bacterium]|nr:HD domain-containing protein [Phycisphaerae bacterium]
MEIQIRDPVHDFISLRDREVKVLGTRALQRLRGIKQLAMANLVYPGVVHTRFDHTLGVCHVAAAMAEQLGLNKDDIELVRFAALLHDIGHGPFSHVSENALEAYADRSKLPRSQKREKIHEIITCHLIRNDQDILRFVSQDTCEQIAKLLTQGHGHRALKSIVSGPLDADKQDYLLRDSLFCGVPYGVFDIHQLHRSLTLVGDVNDKELMIKPDGVHAIEQYALAKYYLTTNVYRHKVRLITDQMLIRAITLGIEKDEISELERLYKFDGTEDFFANYSSYDDARFLNEFGADSRKTTRCEQMLKRLSSRNLLKRVFSERIKTFGVDVRDMLPRVNHRENKLVRANIEQEIAKILNETLNDQRVDADFVVVHGFDIKSVRTTSRNDEDGILVNTRPSPRLFTDESTLFKSINEGLYDSHVAVYAPLTWKNHTERDKICQSVKKLIRELIEEICSTKTAKK